MEMKQIITATVAVILICLVAIPLIDGLENNIQSQIQNTTERYSAAVNGLDEDLTYTTDENKNVLLNGEIIIGTKQETNQTHQLVAICDEFVLVRNTSNYEYFFIFDNTSTKVLKDITFLTDGTYSANQNNGSNVYTGTYTNLVYSCNDGNMGVFSNPNTISGTEAPNVWVNNDSEIWLLSTYYAQTPGNVYLTYKGTTAGMTELLKYTTTTATATYDSTPIIQDETPYSKKITFSNMMTVNDQEVSCWNVQIIAPLEYTGYTVNDKAVLTLVDLIPVLLIAALLVGIGYSIMRRD